MKTPSLLKQAARLPFHAITGAQWTSADAGADADIGSLGDEDPHVIRGQDEPSRWRGGGD